MRIAEIVVRILESEGIEAAFGMPGAAINPVYEFLSTSKQIKHYVARHEEGAVHAADGYFRASGRMALAICTSGPGATNFVTGLYTAQIDSMPLIAISGQNVRAQLGKEAFQCVGIAEIAWPPLHPHQRRALAHRAHRTHRAGHRGRRRAGARRAAGRGQAADGCAPSPRSECGWPAAPTMTRCRSSRSGSTGS